MVQQERLPPGGAIRAYLLKGILMLQLSVALAHTTSSVPITTYHQTLYNCKTTLGFPVDVEAHTAGSPAAGIVSTSALTTIHCAHLCDKHRTGCVAYVYDADVNESCAIVTSDNPVEDELEMTSTDKIFPLCYSSCLKLCFVCLYQSESVSAKSDCLESNPSCDCLSMFSGNTNLNPVKLALISELMTGYFKTVTSTSTTTHTTTLIATTTTPSTTTPSSTTPSTTTPSTTTPSTTTPSTTTPSTTTPSTTTPSTTTPSTTTPSTTTPTSTTHPTTTASPTSALPDIGTPIVCIGGKNSEYKFYIYHTKATLNQSIELCQTKGQTVFQPADQTMLEAMGKCAADMTITSHGMNATFLTGAIKKTPTGAQFLYLNGTMYRSTRMGNGQNMGSPNCTVLIFRNLSPTATNYECSLSTTEHYFSCQDP